MKNSLTVADINITINAGEKCANVSIQGIEVDFDVTPEEFAVLMEKYPQLLEVFVSQMK